MPNYDDITLESLSEFEQDYEMKFLKPHLRAQEEHELEKLPGSLIAFNSIKLRNMISNTSIDGKSFLLVYQGYETSPIHQRTLKFLKLLSDRPPYSDYLKYGHLDLTYNDPLPDHADEEGLILFDLRQNTSSCLPLTADLDGHEVDQWIRSLVFDLRFAADEDLDL